MPSKFLKLVLLSLSLSFNLGCNLNLGESVPPNDHGRLSYSCLSNVDGQVRSFISGDLSRNELKLMMGCVRKALDEFSYIGRGKRADGFEAGELSKFLNAKFLGQSKITPDLLKELMNIKVVIIGGDSNFVTKTEFSRLIDLTHFVEGEALRNLPYMKIYRQLLSEQQKDGLTPQLLNAAKSQLSRTAHNLADLLGSPMGMYSMSSARQLIQQARMFLNWEKEYEAARSVDELIEIVEVYKIFSVGSYVVDGHEVIRPKDWLSFFGTFSEWYGIYLDYDLRLSHGVLTHGEGLKSLIDVVEKAMNLMVYSINHQSQPVLEFKFMNRILKQLQLAGAIPDQFKLEESVQHSFKYFIEKVMRDLSVPLDDAVADGVRVSHIHELRKEFYVWADGQRYISNLYEKAGRKENKDLVVFKANQARAADAVAANEGEREIKRLMDEIEAFYKKSDNRVWIADQRMNKGNKLGLSQNFDSLTRLNTIKVFARLLIRGFAKEPRRAKGIVGITESEASDFYRVAKSLGQDLEYMDPRKEGVGARFFKEANLFTFSANGIQAEVKGSDKHLLNLQETIELLALVYSGSQLRQSIYDSSLGQCFSNGRDLNGAPIALDKVFGKVLIPRDCMLKNLVDSDYQMFSNLPGIVQYFEQEKVEGREKFFSAMFDISRPPCTDGQMVEFGELATLATLAHYIEVVFKTYDRNLDGYMDENEVMSAYSKFRGFIRPVVASETGIDVSEVSEPRVKAVFAFLLSKGTKPDAGFIADGGFAEWWKNTNPGSDLFGDAHTIAWWEVRHFNDDPHQFDKKCEKKFWKLNKNCTLPKMKVTRSHIMRVLGLLAETSAAPQCEGGQPVHDVIKDALQSRPSQPGHVRSILPKIAN